MRLSVNISIWSGLSHIWPRPWEPDPGEDLLWFLLISLLVRGKQAPASWEWLHTEQASPQGGAGEGGTEAREVGSCSAPAGGLCCHQLPAWPLCLTSSDAQGGTLDPPPGHLQLTPLWARGHSPGPRKGQRFPVCRLPQRDINLLSSGAGRGRPFSVPDLCSPSLQEALVATIAIKLEMLQGAFFFKARFQKPDKHGYGF